ncbi:helix-turn-helix domain-containing protein [Motilibacter peucedani]|uniref:helix-turn-helix domain-containing protein n=1 Tax=Motilibacter peucedani TaxID=598650 RepID=UPI0016011515|nr:helix-turn-helix domain-containing protein [Motilibacter peucedani]
MARVRELRDEGMSVRAIAAELGTSKSTVARLLRPPAVMKPEAPPVEPERYFRSVRTGGRWPDDRATVELFLAERWGRQVLVDASGRYFCSACQRLLDEAETLELGNGHAGTPGFGVRSRRWVQFGDEPVRVVGLW